jgi:sterol 3beta-glucosyltransferase
MPAEYPCWLFRSILLQGYLYITAGHLCFYAYLAQKEVSLPFSIAGDIRRFFTDAPRFVWRTVQGATIRSGSLSVRGSKTRRYHKHWLILKDNILSWYPSSAVS